MQSNSTKQYIARLTFSTIILGSLSGGLYFAHKKQMGVIGYTAIGFVSLIGGLAIGMKVAKLIKPDYGQIFNTGKF